MAGQWVTFEQLADIMGADRAEALCRARGGVRVYVPVTASPRSCLAPLVGLPALAALSAALGGQVIVPPNRRRAPARKAEIVRLLEQGVPRRAVALRLDVTERYVEFVAQMTRARPVQASLFPS